MNGVKTIFQRFNEFNVLSLLVAFIGGVVSILSPCILPILPGFLGTFSNLSFLELKQSRYKTSLKVISACILFSIGFLLIFIPLSFGATSLGTWFRENTKLLQYITGTLLLCFGLLLIFGNKLSFGKKIDLTKFNKSKLSPIITGSAMAIGWSPCLGPIMASILTISAKSNNYLGSILLSVFYVLGLATSLSLILILLIFNKKIHSKIVKNSRIIQKICGMLLIIAALIIIFDLSKNISSIIINVYNNLGLRRIALIG